ncbi:depupylase/deamidase Dop [Dietzia cinnamea]|uniref:depupylase/deamidase Dop n=1 Tax=Dietzia cinnamea TaxID=321318 RepID=UPI0021A93F3B|nr:depupylase/deamidase Dop [Dietzia cinnamea]MCT2119462.1 proteasome accessory factor PafA2 [Dietzia cinnamea]MCT2143804.1 proteasome accessory factor PafA2 [Dietzia cinnamea]MCT2302932.1 proteasome accessory factor PafA2 [Dietzia cinnamea]
MNPRGRVIGTEIEFGIVAVGQPLLSSVVSSTQVIKAYTDPGEAAGGADEARWDYGSESPLRDARGFDLGTARAYDPSEFGVTNRVLTNGARFYVDHAHPEYSAPEVDSPRDAVIWDKAGEVIMHRAGVESTATEGNAELKLYKNNVDGKGASYGAHENYLVRRDVDFDGLTVSLAPHLLSRQVFSGAGRVGIGQSGETAGYQLAQRADYIEVLTGLETTLRRGIINTRDEPHAPDETWRRLHVIIGDANMSELATYLKIGTTCLVLDAIEAGGDFSDLLPVDPVEAVHIISHDPTLRATVGLPDGRNVTGLALQREILERVAGVIGDGTGRPGWALEVLGEWRGILDALEENPMSCADRLDWPAKLRLLEGFRTRDGLDWDHARLALIDVQYHDIDPRRGLYNRLVAKGAMRRLVTDDEVEAAVTTPPARTRAWARGRFLAELGDRIRAAGWDHVVVVDSRGHERHVDLTDPYVGSREYCEAHPDFLGPDGPDQYPY